MIKNFINKIYKDTLCSSSGKLSRKSLTMFVSFVSLISIIWLQVFSSMPIFSDKFSISVDINILNILLYMALGQSALTVIDKIKNPQ